MDEQRTLLMVDDTPVNIDLLRGLLRERYRVKAATSGETALKVAAAGTPPDLLLLDVMMPEMDGHEVCRRLKDDPATAAIPVLFVTGTAADAEGARGLALGRPATWPRR